MFTDGMSPYFMTSENMVTLMQEKVVPKVAKYGVTEVFFYGTGCKSPINARMIRKAISTVFPEAEVMVTHDLLAAARALCGDEKGVACILGTGSNSCYYNGSKIMKNSPGLGYVLGDEGSGAYLGKKVLQYYLYKTFDEDLNFRFVDRFKADPVDILDHVYKRPYPNRYLAGFTIFLAENRGHYMIENIIEDGLNDFFFYHLCKYRESWTMPIHFVGGVAYGFKDVIADLCSSYEMEQGIILKNPMQGLVKYHAGQ